MSATKAELEVELRFTKLELERKGDEVRDLEADLDKFETEGYANETRMDDLELFVVWGKPYVTQIAEDAIRAGNVANANTIRDLTEVF